MRHFTRGQTWMDVMLGELLVVQVRFRLGEVVFRKLNGDLIYLSASELRARLAFGGLALRDGRGGKRGKEVAE